MFTTGTPTAGVHVFTTGTPTARLGGSSDRRGRGGGAAGVFTVRVRFRFAAGTTVELDPVTFARNSRYHFDSH